MSTTNGWSYDRRKNRTNRKAGLLVVTTTLWAAPRLIAERIARTCGIDSFGKRDTIRSRFHIDIPGMFKLSCPWVWLAAWRVVRPTRGGWKRRLTARILSIFTSLS